MILKMKKLSIELSTGRTIENLTSMFFRAGSNSLSPQLKESQE